MSQQYQQMNEEQPGEIEIPVNKPPNPQDNIAQQSNQEKPIKSQKKNKKKKDYQESSSSSDDDKRPIIQKIESKKVWSKTKSLQLQQMELEEQNKQALKWAIRLRSFVRIIFLIITTTVLFTGFYVIFEFFAFYDGIQKIPANSRLMMNVTNCRMHIIDSEYQITKSMSSIKYLGASITTLKKKNSHVQSLNQTTIDGPKLGDAIDESSSLLIPDFALEYSIPGRFNIDPNANTSTISEDIQGSNYSYEFTNLLSAQSCQIDLHVYKQAVLDDLSINCFGSCFIVMTSNNISYNTINITGELVELNALKLVTKNLTFNSIQGRFQGNYLQFEQFSDVRLENGDIIFQTDNEMMVNWTHANPHYCYAAPVIANPIVVGCQEAPASEVKAFIQGVGTGKKKKKKDEDKDKDKDDDEKDKDKDKDKKDEKKDKKDKGDKEDETEFLSLEDEIYESFFADEHENLQGNIILLPFVDTYNQSKEFQVQLDQITHQQEKDATAPKSDADPQKDNKTNPQTPKANMQSKTKDIKEKQATLFQPSCFGNSIFCQSLECQTIKDVLTKSNNTINPTNSTDQAQGKPQGSQLRLLKEGDELKKDDKNETDKNANKTEAKIDYKGIFAEAQKKLPHSIPTGLRFLNVTGRFGNVYVNIIKKQNKTITKKDTIIHGLSYASGSVDFDLPSQKTLRHYLKMADDPHNFDPNFVLKVGSKITRSDNYQQWSLTYNPAYSYVKPWWMGTFSFTLMSTASWTLDLNLSPGFCPYHPTLDLDDIYNTRFLIGKYFEKAEHSITTIAWQNSVKFPTENYPKEATGLRKYIESNNEFERWVEIVKLNETSYQLTNINLDQSPATQWAVYVSVIISILTAFFLMLGVLYIINSVYKQILEQVAATNKYSGIEKKNDAEGAQPLMKIAPEKDEKDVKKGEKSDKQDDTDKKKQSSQDMEIVLNMNLGRLLYQLFVLAPPLSAFIDYLCVLISKKYINSAEEFYTHLFQKKQKSNTDSELHNLTTESILGNEMKTLYEKFCFLNGFLEQKLDDEKNIKLLKQKGFKITLKEDAQTESYVRVLLNGMMPKLPVIAADKNALELFINNCCKLTNFEEDNIVVQTFNEQYQEFCVLNHLPYEQPSASELQKSYNITSKYIPQQWVERDEEEVHKEDDASPSFMMKVQNCLTDCLKKCLPEQQTFIINRQKMQNHYSLILNNPELIKTQAELAEANRELILFGGWWMVDFFTVLAHFITTIILIIPLFSFTILEKILYAQYSLIPIQYLITLEDILQNYWVVPLKLYNESTWIKNVLILVGIYWIYSIIDLLYYYISMQFPQENFFRKVSPKTANRIQLIFRQIMWALVLYSAYQLCVFITLALVWLLLGAIVNPTAFLPYATAAATFITVISSKAAQFKEIATDGFETVIAYVQKIAKDQMGSMIAKMDLKGKMNDMMDSEAFKSVAGQAASLGLVDQSTLAHIEENAEALLSNPDKALEAASNAASELQTIAANPQAFVAKMMKELEDKAISMLKEQMAKQIEGYGQELANIALALFKKDKNMFKNNLTQLIYTAANTLKLDSLKKIGQPIMTFVWEFAYPSGNTAQMSPEDYLEALIQPCAECFAQLIQQESAILFQDQDMQMFEPRILSLVLKKAISLQKHLQQENFLGVFNDLDQIIKQLKDEPQFTQIKYLSKYSGLLKIAMSLFEGRKGNQITFHKIFGIISGFFDEIPQLKDMKDLLGLIELLVNSFNKQHKALPTKLVRQRISKALDVINGMIKSRKTNIDKILENPSLITLLFNFMQHNFEKIPKEVIRDVFKFIFENFHDESVKSIRDLVVSEREFKKLIPLMTGVFEMVSLFMEDSRELTSNLHLQANAFSIDEKKAQQLQAIASIKYYKYTTYEGSENEEKLFEKLQTNPLLMNLATSLRLDTKTLLAIISVLLQLYSKQGLQDLYQIISKIHKTEVNRVKQFFSLLILFKCNNATHLSNACVDLNIPREYIILVLLGKKVLDIAYADGDNLQKLGASSDTIDDIQKPDFELKLWMQKLKKEVVAKEDYSVEGGNSGRLKTFLIETISDPTCQITSQKVKDILMDVGNNYNQFAQINQREIDLLTNILLLKNIDLFSSPQALTSDTKQSVYAFASILNVNKQFFEDFINIIFLTNSDRVIQSIQNSQPKVDSTKSEEFISKENQKDYESYLEFMYSKMEMIQKKHQFVYSKMQNLFPMIKLPLPLIEKLLFNKDKGMDINSFYQLAYLIIGKDENGKLPKGTLKQLNKSVSFLTSTLNSQNTNELKYALDKKDLNDGQVLVIQMLNENSKQRSITLLLNFLIQNSKRSKNDEKRPLPQIYHIFACLYLYFTGQWSELQLTFEDQDTKQIQKQNILQYLTKKLDIKQEFFEAIHTFFLNDNQKFTQTMVKFMRRQQACKFEKENPGIKIPLQSLVKIPDQFVLNFINLITGQGYQTSFFSKELNMDSGVVEMISTLTTIKNAKGSTQRIQNYQYLSTSSKKLGPLLDKVGVKGDEFVLILQIIFQDYEINNIQALINGLKLEQKLKVQGVQNLLQLDKVVSNHDKDWLKQISSIKDNQLIKDMKVNPEIAVLTKGLARGKYAGLETYIKKLPHFDYAQCEGRAEYFGLLQGLIGCISGPIPDSFNVKGFLANLYKLLEDPKTKDIPTELTPTNNSVEYAIYKLVQIIQIDPIVLMLTQGMIPAWKLIQETYINEEKKWVNPVLVLSTFLSFQAIPTLLKEIFGEVEWYKQMDELYAKIYSNEQQEVPDFEPFWDVPNWIDEQENCIEEIKKKLFSDTIDSIEELQDMVDICNFNPQVIQFLNIGKNDIKNAQLDVLADSVEMYGNMTGDDDLLGIANIIRNTPSTDPQFNRISYDEAVEILKDDPEEQNKLKSYYPLILYQQMIKVYQETCSLFIDPRRNMEQKVLTDQWIMKDIECQQTPIFTMGIASSLASLRRSFWNPLESQQPRDEEHYKITTQQIDFILTSIERMYYFKNFTDYFSKTKAALLIGLSCGFAISAENFISANCTAGLVTYQTALEHKSLQANQQKKVLHKLKFLKSLIERRQEEYSSMKSRFFKSYQFNKILKYSLDIISEPENYLKFSIQNIETSVDQGINWDDYFFDIGFLQSSSQITKWIRAEGIDKKVNAQTRLVILKERLKQLMDKEIHEQQEAMKKAWINQQKLSIEPKQNSSQEPTLEEAVLEVIDVRTGKNWQSVLNSQEQWSHACYQYNDNLRLLIDIWKGNYQSIIEPDTYFTDEEPAAAMAYYGLAALSGSFYKVKNGWKQNTPQQLSAYLNACCWNTASNKKNLQEILSVFLKSFEGFTVLAQSLQQNVSLVNSFINLSMQLYDTDIQQSEDQLTLIKSMNLSQNDTEVLNSLIDAYLGRMDVYYQLADYSQVINPSASTKFKPVQMNNLIKKKRGEAQPQAKQEQQQNDQKKPDDTKPEEIKQDPPEQQQQQGNPQNLVPPPPELQNAQSKEQKVKKLPDKKGQSRNQPSFSSSADRYFSIKTILLKLLYGFDQSQLHQIEKIDAVRFDFSKYSALSSDPKKTEEYFILLLWQLAQAITKETLPNDLRLPILTDFEIGQSNELANEYKTNLTTIRLITQFIIKIVNDDYSFFFQKDEDVSVVLKKLSFTKDEPETELQFLRAMIGLKSNKMMLIQNKRALQKNKKNNQNSNNAELQLDIQKQVENLIDSKIIDVRLENKNDDENKELSKNIALLFLAISSGNIEKMYSAILPLDSMSAGFILTMFMWKNISTIIGNEEFLKPENAMRIIPPLQLLPLLIYSQINEQQDKKNGSLRNNQRQKVINSFQIILQAIKKKQDKPGHSDQEFYNKIEKMSQSKKHQTFSWSLWLLKMPEFLKIQSQIQMEMEKMDNSKKASFSRKECDFIFKIMTGSFFVEKIEQVKFIGPIFNLYKICNQIINYPETLKIQNIDFKKIIPNTIITISDYVPDAIRTYLGVFDKFVQLFVFIQIPERSLKVLKDSSDKLEQQHNQIAQGSQVHSQRDEEEQNYDDDDEYQNDDDENDDDGEEDNEEDDEQNDNEEKKQLEDAPADGLAQITETINEFILDVLGQTVNSLWLSFKEENRQSLSDQIDKLNKEINEKKANQIKQDQSKRLSTQLPMLTQAQIMQPQQIQQAQQIPMQQQLGTSINGQPQMVMQQQIPMQQQQMPMQQQIPIQQQQMPIQQQIPMQQLQMGNQQQIMPSMAIVPQGYNFQEKAKKLQELQVQLTKIDEQSTQVKRLITGIILLLTGYNIDDLKAQSDSDKKLQVLCFIIDSVLFKNLNLLQYVNTVIIRELFQEIQNINNCPLKSITNQDFLFQIESLLYTLTGQDPNNDVKEKKQKGGNNQQKDKQASKSDQWTIALPKRAKIIELPMGVIKCIFGLASYNFEYVPKLLKELSVSDSAIKIVEQIIKQVQEMGVFGGKQLSIGGSQQDPKKAKEIQELMKKIQEGTATNQDMFKAIDEDGTKSISKTEYGTLAKRLGMNLSEHRINEIFANIKKGSSSANQDSLNEKEFDQAMKYLQQKNTDMALDFLGISPGLLTMLLIQGAIILLLIFIFIFLGIQAFALGGTFGAVVNSILPMAAGGGAGSKTEKVSEKKGDDDQIGDSVDKTQKIIQSDTI